MKIPHFNVVLVAMASVALMAPTLCSESQTPTSANALEILPKHSAAPPIVQFEQQIKLTSQEGERRDSRTRLTLGFYSGKPIADPGTRVVNGQSETVDLTFIDTVTILKPGEIKDPPGLPILGTSVVIGRITNGDAYLNDQLTGVFSEYRILVKEVLKSDPTSIISVEDEINAWRIGGSLKFRSGHTKHFLIAGVGFPKIGADYLFFLRTTDSGNKDYAISTAFSLSDQVVYSLDANHAQCVFDGTRTSDFLDTVRKEILARRPGA